MAWTRRAMAVLLPLVVVLGQCLHIGACDFIDDSENLLSALLSNYSIKVRPNFQTHASVYMTISSLNYLNIAAQSMSINVLPAVTWTDPRLSWTSTDYGGLESVITAPEDIWTPPIVIENAVENVGVMGGKDRDATPLRIRSNGLVTWIPPTEISTSCEMLIAKYPFDTQVCGIVLLGWSYPLSEMNITAVGIDTASLYSANGEFDLTESRVYHTEIGDNTQEFTFRKLHFEFTFRRKWQFYGQNLLMPIVLNSILMNAVFALPIDSGEKMSYCLTVLLSYVVFLTWVTENLPPVSTDTSILQVYLATVLCLGCLATLLTLWVLNLHHTSPDKPMSPFYRKLASAILVPFSQLTSCSKRMKDDSEDDLDPPPLYVSNVNKVAPVSPRPVSTMSRKPLTTGHYLNDGTNTMGQDEIFGSDDREGGKTRTCTWQELSVLLDYFCFWIFGAVLVILTSVIMGLLHGYY